MTRKTFETTEIYGNLRTKPEYHQVKDFNKEIKILLKANKNEDNDVYKIQKKQY